VRLGVADVDDEEHCRGSLRRVSLRPFVAAASMEHHRRPATVMFQPAGHDASAPRVDGVIADGSDRAVSGARLVCPLSCLIALKPALTAAFEREDRHHDDHRCDVEDAGNRVGRVG